MSDIDAASIRGVTVTISTGRDDESVAALLEARAAVIPPLARTVPEYQHELAQDTEARVLVARRDVVVGVAELARRLDRGQTYRRLQAAAYVPHEHRRTGIGSRLYAALSDHARMLGSEGFQLEAWKGDPDGIAWASRRGFVTVSESQAVALALDRVAPPPIKPPPGIEMTSLAERPDLTEQLYRLAGEVLPDEPGAGPAPRVDDYDRWHAKWIAAPGLVRSAYVIALKGDQAIGFACLDISAARPGVAVHEMTGVARAWRGSGIASALKRAQIAWAIQAGLLSLEAENDEDNAPMKAINRRLGYTELPGWVELEGPLTPL